MFKSLGLLNWFNFRTHVCFLANNIRNRLSPQRFHCVYFQPSHKSICQCSPKIPNMEPLCSHFGSVNVRNFNQAAFSASNRMILSAVKFDDEWPSTVRFNFASPLDEKNVASQITANQTYR